MTGKYTKQRRETLINYKLIDVHNLFSNLYIFVARRPYNYVHATISIITV